MALNFPNTPNPGDTYTSGSAIWQWDGTKWNAGSSGAFLPLSGGTLTGPLVLNADPSAALGAATKQYADAGSAAAEHNVGRNLLHNGLFNVAQRGAGPWTVPGYTLDRWQLYFVTDTASVSQNAFSDASRAQIGDEAAAFAIGNTFTGNAAAGALTQINQSIENVRRLAGKTVTVSFWAAASATQHLGINIAQIFGTGGSPSGAVYALATGANIALSTTWTRYTATIALPSISGLTLGTNNDHCTQLQFWMSSGATNNAHAGNIGVQSGSIYLWGVQLELGGTATPLEKLDPQQDLAKCQRFYALGTIRVTGSANAGGNIIGNMQSFNTAMRATPTMVTNFTTQANCTGAVAPLDAYGFEPYATATAAGGVNLQGTFTASADL
jgi:hypothetical protein